MTDWKACTEAERIENARLVRLLDEAKAENKKLREVLEPLLDHYLHCYEGNHDELALNAKKLLGSS